MTAMVKTFRARDTRSALAAVKAALGPDAVILSTQEVGGGLFKSPEIEVTAAVEATPPPPPTPAPAAPPVAHGRARYAGAAMEPPVPPNLNRRQPDTNGIVADELIALRSAVESMRQQMKQQATRDNGAPLRFPEPVMKLYEHLLSRGLDPVVAEELLRLAAGAHGTHPAMLWHSVKDLLAERLVAARAPWLPGPRRVIAFVGPTGVGKTTTLAKVAARARVESKLKVALVTVDTYRVGAADQVARYGAMMSVPTRVAQNQQELVRALEASAGADLVLIDTAGRSRPEEIARQGELLRVVPGIELFLCLSAATGARELHAASKRYAPLKPSRLIFTKLDEAVEPGGVISAFGPVGRPIACVTDGQRVPDDIHAPTTAQLVELVVGKFQPQVAATESDT